MDAQVVGDIEGDVEDNLDFPNDEMKGVRKQRCKELEELLKNDDGYEHRPKTHGSDGKAVRANCWKVIHEIFEKTNNNDESNNNSESNNNRESNYFFCIICKNVMYSQNAGGNTSLLNRYFKKCGKLKTKKPLSKADRQKLKFAFADFVATDLRSYNTVDCGGFKGMAVELMQFGQRNPMAESEQLLDALSKYR